MKKIKYFLTLILVIFITGCSNYNMSMKINKDKSMIYTVIITSDGYNSTLANNISVYKEKYEQYGYLVKEYNEDNKYGMIISKHFENIDDISYGNINEEFNLLYLYNDGYNEDVESKMFNVEKGFLKNTYTANFYVDLSNLGINLNDATVTYSVELPKESLSNNASLVSEDKNVLTWNITSLGKNEIDYVFELNSHDDIYYIIAVLIVIYLFFSIIINLFRKEDDDKEKRNHSNPDDINKKIENLTSNAIKNSNNKNGSVNKIDTVSNMDINHSNIPGPIKLIPDMNNTDTNYDITALKTPDNKKKGFFGMKKNNKTNEDVYRVNNNEEFNMMIENINNGNINNGSNNNEIIQNSSSVNNINNISENEIVNVKPIFDINPDTLNSSVVDNSSINNINNVEKIDNNIEDENQTFDSLKDNENNADGPIIRVNSKSIVVEKEKNENL